MVAISDLGSLTRQDLPKFALRERNFRLLRVKAVVL